MNFVRAILGGFSLVASVNAQLVPRIAPLILDVGQASESEQYYRDVDGDGDQDLLFLSQRDPFQFASLSLFLERLPDGSFSEAQFFAAPDTGEYVAAVDINGDGHLDPLVLFIEDEFRTNRPLRYSVRTYPSLPEGGFSNEERVTSLPAGGDDAEVRFSEDGRIPYLLKVSEIENDVGGTTLTVIEMTPGSRFGREELSRISLPIEMNRPLDLAPLWGNFDGQGGADLLLLEYRGSSLLGTIISRDVAFSETPETPFTLSSSVDRIQVDDLNGDGLDDLWIPLEGGGFRYLLRNSSGDGFEGSQRQTIRAFAGSIPLGWGRETPASPMTFLALSGEQSSDPQNLLSTRFGEWIVASTPTNFSDLHDEAQDFSPFLTNETAQGLLLLDGSAEAPGITFFPGFSVRGPVEMGFSFGSQSLQARLGIGVWTTNSNGVNFNFITRPPLDSGLISFLGSEIGFFGSQFFYPADYDDDGRIDLIVGPDTEQNFFIRFNEGDGQFSDERELDLLPSRYLSAVPDLILRGVTVGDVDLDGDSDLVIDYLSPDITNLFGGRAVCLTALNSGDGTFTLPENLPTAFQNGFLSRSCATIALVDWDGDGDLDIIDNTVGWRENLGGGEFSTSTRFLAPPGTLASDAFGNPLTVPTSLSFGDVNGDGNLDVFTSLYGLLSEGNLFTIDPFSRQLVSIDSPLGGAAANLPIGAPGLSRIGAVLLSDGTGRIVDTVFVPEDFLRNDAFGNPAQIGPVFLADLNLDGSDDLVLAVAATDGFGNPFTAGVRWVQSRGGENPFPSEAFDEVALFPSFSGPLRDFDGDGTLEYVQANGFVAPSTFGPVFSAGFDFVGRNTNFLPSNLIEDFDGDGDVDFVYQYGNEFQTYFLVRNQIVDERSGVTFAMRDLGVLGADANPNSDADGDGETNFEEFIFGGNPIEPSIVGDRSRLNVGVSSERAATFSVNKAALAAGVNYRMKVSSDLEEWQSVPIDFVQDEDAFWEDWQALPLNSPNCFYRLVVEP